MFVFPPELSPDCNLTLATAKISQQNPGPLRVIANPNVKQMQDLPRGHYILSGTIIPIAKPVLQTELRGQSLFIRQAPMFDGSRNNHHHHDVWGAQTATLFALDSAL